MKVQWHALNAVPQVLRDLPSLIEILAQEHHINIDSSSRRTMDRHRPTATHCVGKPTPLERRNQLRKLLEQRGHRLSFNCQSRRKLDDITQQISFVIRLDAL